MSPTKTKKQFDCLAFKQKVQERIYEDTKLLSEDDQIRYFDREAQAGPLGRWWNSIRSPRVGSMKQT
jgi:hypothetical protein